MRAKQRSKKISKEAAVPALKKWHATTREKLIRTGFNDAYDPKWGRFKPFQRLNVDQTPMPFVLYGNKTYEHTEKGEDQYRKKVWLVLLLYLVLL